MTNRIFRVAIAGLGTIGSGVAEVLLKQIEQGAPFQLAAILEKYPDSPNCKVLHEQYPSLFTTDADKVLSDPSIDILVETIGGKTFARELITRALENGKHVVTANKDLIASHGKELLELAGKQQRYLLFEASVGGAIPVLRLLQDYFYVRDIQEVLGIVNGTTNYILSKMSSKGVGFSQALSDAQHKGYAEPDPTNDIKGYDARYKLVILTWLITGIWLNVDDIHVEGIDFLDAEDFDYAARMDRQIKLIACMKQEAGNLQAFVLPLLVPKNHALAQTSGATNIIVLKEKNAKEIAVTGQGAGKLPTATAILADIYKIIRYPHIAEIPYPSSSLKFLPFPEYEFKHTLRLDVYDRPGIVGHIGTVLSRYGINIYALEQLPKYHQVNREGKHTVIFTISLEPCKEELLQNAVREIENADYIAESIVILRELPGDFS
ncbi:MAG: homoserine dehydrogenase [SAR324 cluster bacterium]|nr:homoserine dehydrogenase [SAR324 cluster bacterium]